MEDYFIFPITAKQETSNALMKHLDIVQIRERTLRAFPNLNLFMLLCKTESILYRIELNSMVITDIEM